jgi:hypothetical protein
MLENKKAHLAQHFEQNHETILMLTYQLISGQVIIDRRMMLTVAAFLANSIQNIYTFEIKLNIIN